MSTAKRAMLASLVLITCVGVSALTASADEVFCDDFTEFDTSNWTHHGGVNVDVDDTNPVDGRYPDAVYVYGARDWSPASRITHAMPTGDHDFEVQFDYLVHGYTYHGRMYIGWMNIDDFAGVQKHDPTYAWIHHWGETGTGPGHDSEGNPSSGLWLSVSSADGGNASLTVTDDGLNLSYDDFLTGHNDGQWYTLKFGRTGTTGYLEVRNRGTQELVGSCSITLPSQRNYDFFHISTVDNMCNNCWARFEIDNLCLTVEDLVVPAVSEWGLIVLTLLFMTAGKVAFMSRRQLT